MNNSWRFESSRAHHLDSAIEKPAVPDSGLRIAEVFRREAGIEGNFSPKGLGSPGRLVDRRKNYETLLPVCSSVLSSSVVSSDAGLGAEQWG